MSAGEHVPAASAAGPEMDEDSAAFWEALRSHEILLQKCTNCGEVRFPPAPGCPRCGSLAAEHVVASGRGEVYSWIVVHRPIGSFTEADVPVVIATIQLDEGCRLLGRLDATEQPRMGMRVRPLFRAYTDWTELAFAPEREG